MYRSSSASSPSCCSAPAPALPFPIESREQVARAFPVVDENEEEREHADECERERLLPARGPHAERDGRPESGAERERGQEQEEEEEGEAETELVVGRPRRDEAEVDARVLEVWIGC